MGPTMRNMLLGLVENLDRQQAELMRRQLEASGDSIVPVIVNALILAVLLLVFSIMMTSLLHSIYMFSYRNFFLLRQLIR